IPDISVAQFLLNETPTETAAAPSPVVLPPTPRTSTIVWKAAAALLLLTTIVGGVLAYLARSATPAVARFFVQPPEKTSFSTYLRARSRGFISPDVKMVHFKARY